MNEAFQVVAAICAIFERLQVGHLIGGSLATSVHGVPRATQHVDVVADLRRGHAQRFVAAADAEFHVDEGAVSDAIEGGTSFNALHRETVFEVGVFVAGEDPWIAEELQRTRFVEDVVFHKLRWYDEGGRVSDRQWRDVLGMIAVHGTDLDRAYLDRWADHLDLRRLLDTALDAST